jgi:hypothetical protein
LKERSTKLKTTGATPHGKRATDGGLASQVHVDDTLYSVNNEQHAPTRGYVFGLLTRFNMKRTTLSTMLRKPCFSKFASWGASSHSVQADVLGKALTSSTGNGIGQNMAEAILKQMCNKSSKCTGSDTRST